MAEKAGPFLQGWEAGRVRLEGRSPLRRPASVGRQGKAPPAHPPATPPRTEDICLACSDYLRIHSYTLHRSESEKMLQELLRFVALTAKRAASTRGASGHHPII